MSYLINLFRQWRCYRKILLSIVMALPVAGCKQETLSADFTFSLDCNDQAAVMIEKDIEDILNENGFRVANIARLAEQLKERYTLTRSVVAVRTSDSAVFWALETPFAKNKISVALTTPPPTVHNIELEAALIDLAKNHPDCQVEQVARNENTEDRLAFFKRHKARLEGWLEQYARYREKL